MRKQRVAKAERKEKAAPIIKSAIMDWLVDQVSSGHIRHCVWL